MRQVMRHDLSGAVVLAFTASLWFAPCQAAPAAYEELVANGDFESGNTGFTNEYIYRPGLLWPEGPYTVDDDPADNHPYSWPSYGDHTTGTGEMMIVNAAIIPNVTLWEQMVPVLSHTRYSISAWVSTVVPPAPELRFLINGEAVGVKVGPGGSGYWREFATSWDSGDQTAVQFRIVETSIAGFGNDFAIDDISLKLAPIPGDANLDGNVDDDDLSMVLANWTGAGGTGGTWATGDFDDSGSVSDSDLSLLLANWSGPASAVPDPATIALLALAAPTLLMRRRKLSPGSANGRP